jgi:uncharacterized membrane protein YtjA (UPF0391 family)
MQTVVFQQPIELFSLRQKHLFLHRCRCHTLPQGVLQRRDNSRRENVVLRAIAGFLGFGGIAFAAAGIAKILFFIFLVIFVVTLVMHLMRRV